MKVIDKFEGTRKALAHFCEEELPKLNRMLDTVRTDAELESWEKIQDTAIARVRAAVLEDTKEYNGVAHVALLSVADIKDLVERCNTKGGT